MARAALVGVLLVFAAAASGCATTSTTHASGVELRGDHQEASLVTVKHRVEAGQTLYRIARAYGLPPEELAIFNGITDPRQLAVGSELVIPGAIEKRPVPGPNGEVEPEPAPVAGAEKKPKLAADDKWRPPEKTAPATAKPGPAFASPKLSWPLRGVLYGRFGKKGKEPHDGIDLAAPEGTPVKTAAPGTVLFAGEQKGYGLIAIVQHEEDVITLYAHNRDLRVKTGQKVREGQVIATVGQSGATSGPHLHFEVRKNGKPVDPIPLLGAPPSPSASKGEGS